MVNTKSRGVFGRPADIPVVERYTTVDMPGQPFTVKKNHSVNANEE